MERIGPKDFAGGERLVAGEEKTPLPELDDPRLEQRLLQRIAELERLTLRLQHEIAERNRTELLLQAKHHQLAHAMRISTMGEMVTSIANEVNQPLQAIRNYVNELLIQARYVSETSAEVDVLMEISREVDRSAAVLRRVRGFIRQAPHDPRRVSLHEIAQDAVQLVAHEASKRHCVIACLIPAELPRIVADTVQIQQVFVSLLQNALDAMDANSRDARAITIAAEVRDTWLDVEVIDRGPGVPPRNWQRLLEPFVTTKPDGLGMGLAICRSIVEAHGGELIAIPTSDEGGHFRFSLPIPPPINASEDRILQTDAAHPIRPPHLHRSQIAASSDQTERADPLDP